MRIISVAPSKSEASLSKKFKEKRAVHRIHHEEEPEEDTSNYDQKEMSESRYDISVERRHSERERGGRNVPKFRTDLTTNKGRSKSDFQDPPGHTGRRHEKKSYRDYSDVEEEDEDDDQEYDREGSRRQASSIIRRHRPPKEDFSRPHSERQFNKREHRDVEKRYRRRESPPSDARTFPAGMHRSMSNRSSKSKNKKQVKMDAPSGKRQYPKEKWFKRETPAPSLHDTRGRRCKADTDSLDSTDDYLRSYSKYGKYQIDKHSLIAPRYNDNDDQVYNKDVRYLSSPAAFRRSSSDDDVARWRSADEDDDSEFDSPDWDENVEIRDDVAVDVLEASAHVFSEDEGDLTSLEMVNFDPKNVQVLTSEHHVLSTQHRGSFEEENEIAHKISKRMMKSQRRYGRGRVKPDEIEVLQGRDGRGARVLSSISHSGSFPESASKSTRNSSASHRHEMQGMASLIDDEMDEELDEELESEADYSDELSDADYGEELSEASGSSGSFSLHAQMQFRKKQRAEHRRRLWKKSAVDFLLFRSTKGGTDSRKKSLADPPGVRPTGSVSRKSPTSTMVKKRGVFGFFGGRNATNGSHDEADHLPWEDQPTANTSKLHFFMQKLRGEQQPHRSGDDLPFPKSDSFDASLASHDKYREIIDDLMTMSHNRNNYKEDWTTEEAEVASSSRGSYATDNHQNPVYTKRGIGHSLKAIFLR